MQNLRVLIVGLSGNAALRGVERVVYESAKALAKNFLGNEIGRVDLLCGKWQDYYDELSIYGVKVVRCSCSQSLLSRHWYLWANLQFIARNYDVVHLMNSMPYFSFFSEKKVVTLHDLAEFACPGKYSKLQAAYRRLVTRFVSKSADSIVTVSSFSQEEIRRLLGYEAVVAPNGLDHFVSRSVVGESCERFQFVALDGRHVGLNFSRERYFLYFGVIEKTKGLDVALSSFSRLKESGRIERGAKFFVAGSPGNLYADLGKYLDREDIYFLGRVDDSCLQNLIYYSSCVVFLSEYEGFGFPAPEAVVLGAKVLVPEGSVFHDVCGAYCYPCCTKDESLLDAAMIHVFYDKLPWTPADACCALHKRYNWSNVSRALLDAYKM